MTHRPHGNGTHNLMNLLSHAFRRIPPRGWVAYGHDIFMAAASFPLALYLRMGDDLWTQPVDVMTAAGLFFTAETALIFYVMGLYRGVWRYASINDLLAITNFGQKSLDEVIEKLDERGLSLRNRD